MELLKQIKWNVIFVSAVVALLGLIILLNPTAAALSICSLIGWFLIISGALTLASYFIIGKSNFVLIMGLIQLIPGVYIVLKPEILVNFISLFLGIIILVYGFACLREGAEYREMGYPHWWVNLIVGFITLAMGTLVIVNPFDTGAAIMMFAGASMVIHGVINIISVMIIVKDIKKM